jgi:biopolymer transport protein ExbD
MSWRLSARGRESAVQEEAIRPQLTSLIDVMTILLVFLVKSFSVQGNLITPATDLQLPLSSAHTPPRLVTTIALSTSALAVQGHKLMPLAEIAQAESLLIQPLHDWLKQNLPPADSTDPPLEVLIEADKSIEFAVIKRVMFTCSRAGVEDFSVLVMEDE